MLDPNTFLALKILSVLISSFHYIIYFMVVSSPIWILRAKSPAYINLYLAMVMLVQTIFYGCPVYEIEVFINSILGEKTSENQIFFADLYNLNQYNFVYVIISLGMSVYFLKEAHKYWNKVENKYDFARIFRIQKAESKK